MLRNFIALIILVVFPLNAFAEETDRRVGYYYPPITSEEVFDRTIAQAPKAAPAIRTAFVTELTKSQLDSPSVSCSCRDGSNYLTRTDNALFQEERNSIWGDVV